MAAVKAVTSAAIPSSKSTFIPLLTPYLLPRISRQAKQSLARHRLPPPAQLLRPEADGHGGPDRSEPASGPKWLKPYSSNTESLDLQAHAIWSRLHRASSSSNPLQPALDILLAQQQAPSSSDIDQRTTVRIQLYTNIADFYLSPGPQRDLVALWALLQLQHAEGLAIKPRILTLYLKRSLASLAPNVRPMDLVAAILPFIPQKYDIRLLTLILHTVIKYASPEPDDVREMISGSISADGTESDMRDWDLELWDVYFTAILQKKQFREAISLLSDFRSAVSLARKRISTASTTDAEAPSIKHSAIVRPYISLLAHWAHISANKPRGSGRPGERRNGSAVPVSVATHCLHTLRGVEPPIEFFNVWMNAERVAGNLDRAKRIWEAISLRDARGERSPLSIEDNAETASNTALRSLLKPGIEVSLDVATWTKLQPDATTYHTLFRLLKGDGQQPTRSTLRGFFGTKADDDATNAAISTIFALAERALETVHPRTKIAEPDLPAVYVLLEQLCCSSFYRGTGSSPQPEAIVRTIDIVSAGLLRMAQCGLKVFDNDPCFVRHRPYANAKRPAWLRVRTNKHEISLTGWDFLSRELDAFREDRGRNPELTTLLPVGKPLARLVEEATEKRDRSKSDIEQVELDTIVVRSDTRGARYDTAVRLVRPMQHMLRWAIGYQMQREGVSEVDDARIERAIEFTRRDLGVSTISPVGHRDR